MSEGELGCGQNSVRKTGLLRRFLRGGRRGERGVTMIEFALVMIPFFLLLFGTFEVGLVFWGNYELENATEDAARQIRTGQVASANMNDDGFRELVCSRVSLLSQCRARLRLDVRSFASFDQIGGNGPDPLVNGELQNNFQWQPGGPRAIVLVTTFYEWPLINPMTSASLSNMGSGNRLLRASAAFRNEPWPG